MKITKNTEKFIFYTVTAFAGFAIAMLINLQIAWDKEWVDVAKAITSVLIFASIIMAIINYRYVKAWNQKEAAIKALYESQKTTAQAIKLLDKELNIIKRFEKRQKYSICELHNAFGFFTDDGDFYFYGKNNKAKPQSKTDKFSQENKTKNGRAIYDAIEEYLNEIEYIATACEEEIFDKEVVYDLKAGGIINGFIVFQNFIYHNRYDKRHGYGPTLYENFEKLASEFAKRRGVIFSAPKEAEYLTPFDRK